MNAKEIVAGVRELQRTRRASFEAYAGQHAKTWPCGMGRAAWEMRQQARREEEAARKEFEESMGIYCPPPEVSEGARKYALAYGNVWPAWMIQDEMDRAAWEINGPVGARRRRRWHLRQAAVKVGRRAAQIAGAGR